MINTYILVSFFHSNSWKYLRFRSVLSMTDCILYKTDKLGYQQCRRRISKKKKKNTIFGDIITRWRIRLEIQRPKQFFIQRSLTYQWHLNFWTSKKQKTKMACQSGFLSAIKQIKKDKKNIKKTLISQNLN